MILAGLKRNGTFNTLAIIQYSEFPHTQKKKKSKLITNQIKLLNHQPDIFIQANLQALAVHCKPEPDL